MNAGGNNDPINPIEHVFFNTQMDGKYIGWVHYFSQKNGGS
jgi:hypothetical protein